MVTIQPIYGDLGDGLLLFYPHYSSIYSIVFCFSSLYEVGCTPKHGSFGHKPSPNWQSPKPNGHLNGKSSINNKWLVFHGLPFGKQTWVAGKSYTHWVLRGNYSN